MRKSVVFMLGFLALWQGIGAGCAQAAEAAPPQPYTRVTDADSNTVQLQIALRKFVPAHQPGPVIWLAGVMHVAEPDYYHTLQHFLDSQTIVLYEGIDPDSHPHHVHDPIASDPNAPEPVRRPTPNTNSGYSMQSTLARSLGLVFQLEAIDYDRTNFLNSDLSVQEIQGIMAEGYRPARPGEEGSNNVSFDTLLQIMDGSSFLGSLFKMGLNFMATSPKLQAVAKLTLIEAVGRLKGDLSDVQGLPQDWKHLLKVLIEARNQHLVRDLGGELKKIPATGSIAADEVWFPAFSVDTRQSGITPDEAQWVRTLIEGQMDQLQAKQP
jgi:hypothetical protein